MSSQAVSLMTVGDYFVLKTRLARALAADDPFAFFLHRKIKTAILIVSQSIPSHIVTIDSQIVCHVGSEAIAGKLVDGEAGVAAPNDLSIGTPLGLALLGMSVGETSSFVRRDGCKETIFVARVTYQPEADKHGSAIASRDPYCDRVFDRRARVVVPFSRHLKLQEPRVRYDDDPGPSAA